LYSELYSPKGAVVAKNTYRVENRLYEADDLVEARDGDRSAEVHRKRIEPWLSALFQSEHLNLLVGSGFSLGLASAAGADGLSMAMTSIHPELDVFIDKAAAETAKKMGRGKPNIEDQFRSALALEAGLGILNDSRHGALTSNIHRAFSQFANTIVSMEQGIARAGERSEGNKVKFERLLAEFLLSFASRTASRDRLHVFTTNYDRLIERGFDLIAARPIDRFVGALTPRFRASRFEVDVHYTPPGGRGEARPLEGVVRFTKLHGSLDWLSKGNHIERQGIPFGGNPDFTEDDAESLLIFPNAAKDIETAFYPYAELFRDFSSAICRPNAALVTYGYGFGDDHVNRIVFDMLTLPSTHLVIISYDEAEGRIERFIARCGRTAQISTLIGPHLAGLQPLVDNFLPKPAIDTITQRQSELLERRGRRVETTVDPA
jgi:hypothetical protein